MKSFESKSHLIDSICDQIRKMIPKNAKILDTFAHHFFKRVPFEFLQQMLQSEVESILYEVWNLFQVRQPLESLIKIKEYQLNYHMMPRLGIFMVNLDQPFLIDSVTAFLDQKGFKTEIVVHPVLGVERTKAGKLLSLVDLKEILPKKPKNTSSKTAKNLPSQPESIAFIQVKAMAKQTNINHLQNELNHLISQVRNVVSDWPFMQGQLHEMSNNLMRLPHSAGLPTVVERQDTQNFLTWLEHGNFVFLGSRYFPVESINNRKGNQAILCLEIDSTFPKHGLFRDDMFVNSDDLVPVFSRARFISDKYPTTPTHWPTCSITKTNARSTVHRTSRIDSIEVLDWDENGYPRGLYQIIGIFTKAAFAGSAFDIPIIGRKVSNVFNQFGLAPQWHDGKTLVSILNSIPHDELFYLSEHQIFEVSQNVLNFSDQHDITLAVRPDQYGRYVSVMVFLPKEKYSVSLKDRFGKILEERLKGKISSENTLLGELDYARLIFVITFSKPCLITYNETDIEKALYEAALGWDDHLERLINKHYDEENTAILVTRYQKAFPTTYIDEFSPEEALIDIGYIEKITDKTPIDLYLYKGKDHHTLKIKIFHSQSSLSLSTLLPILQNLGLQVVGETSYFLEKDGYSVWIHDFDVDPIELEHWKPHSTNLIHAFHQIWDGTAENDVLFQLILKGGLNVRQVTLLRAYLKFLRQIQLPYSLAYLEETLTQYPAITHLLVTLFELRFGLKQGASHHSQRSHCHKEIYRLLEAVDRLDHDRILRRLLNAIESTVRTNYFQQYQPKNSGLSDCKPYLAFKFDCRKLDELPQPSPLYEIFIYSPRVEACHLRGAKVARGGIRWSDRPEDFRTEILGLMKAQTVKNSVIVPLGSKGGFVVKNQAKFTDPTTLAKEVVSCYRLMMQGMLDVTDNLVKGKVVHPRDVYRWDEDDPYLVVAADKGTAEFSDIANTISADYSFWLGDAFASGGSSGYDHKKMAITARGAWESAKRHFRELKVDVQTSPFTVVGVGDMSGDVFGNGMLRSNQIQLQAAFDHRYIFLDPNPDQKKSFLERQRLFNLPKSSWMDYNKKLISKGGGVFDRSSKSIKLSPEIRHAFRISSSEMTPDNLIKHILCLSVDLLYFGGIGTFVKASSETHTDVSDRSNNDIRVDAKAVQAKVIVEGANLAMTQRARIEYALKGGRLNTDAIDNSAGVDCSDHEVNLKILFSTLGKSVSLKERNTLLKKMTDEVASLVLADNYRQTQILTVLEAMRSADINTYQSLLRFLEVDVKLDRTLEALPDDETLEQRRARNQGMTRPELSVILAYSKIGLYEKILASTLPDEPDYQTWLHEYFPNVIRKRFAKAIGKHPLRREITATVLANEVINRVGPSFIYEITQACGVSEVEVVKAFFLACHVLELKDLWQQIDRLDDLLVADVQVQVLLDINQSLEQIILWFLRHPEIKHTSFSGFKELLSKVPQALEGDQQHIFMVRKHGFTHVGISETIAQNLSAIPFFPALLDIMFLCKKNQKPSKIAQTYFKLRSKIGLDWLMLQAAQIHVDTEWQRNARTILIDDLAQVQYKLTHKVMMESENTSVDVWIEEHKENIHHVRPILANIKSTSHPDLSMLNYAMRQLERLV